MTTKAGFKPAFFVSMGYGFDTDSFEFEGVEA